MSEDCQKRTVFDVIKNLSFEKNYELKEDDLTLYDSFIVNKAFSLHPDTIFYANEINLCDQLPDHMKYDYYMNSLRKRKRWSVWPKKKYDNEIIDLICRAYNVSYKKAITINKLLNEEQIQTIKLKFEKDNKNNEKQSK